MTKMSLRVIPIVVYFLVFYAASKDLSRAKLGRKSNKVLVQYEGTLKEVKDYGSSLGLEFKTKVFEDWYVFTIPKETDPLAPIDVPDLHISLSKEKKRDKRVKFFQQERYLSRRTRSLTINDREWLNQWYLNSSISYDFIADSPDPSHKDLGDGHGTSCAGIVGAVKNTDCVIGIAHEVNMGVARVLSHAEEVNTTTSDEALALTHKYEDIDIYSNSWGPDGEYIESLPEVIQEAFELAIKKGRNGKGVIYTWASGNGGEYLDNCNADGYSSSMYTISIAAVNGSGLQSYYSEPCTSILSATFSGDDNIRDIATTGPDGTCIGDFSGTSAACPMATGIIALTLQANPDLTWRDIQHMIVEFSNFSALIHTRKTHSMYEYYKNGAGKQVSIWSGFGLMDAMAMVENAPTWSTVPPRLSCTSGDLYVDIVSDKQVDQYHEFNNCPIKYLEHVEVTVLYDSTYRGGVEFYLLSPMNTESKIFSTRKNDDSYEAVKHKFMSVHTWREDPNGTWDLKMKPAFEEVTEMHVYEWRLDVFGTATDPLTAIPPEGTFGSPCNTSSSCTSVENGGCLIDSDEMCDNICITCKNGYHFNGDYCEKDCPPLSAVENGYVNVSSESGLMVANYTCYLKAKLGAGDETRTCGSDGIWTGKEPTCDLVDCGPLADPDNGIVYFGDNVFYDYATYECDEGYAISEGDEERVCLQDGEWSGTEPTCSRGTSVHGTPCSKENRTQDLSTCLSKITEELFEHNKYWFGNDYAIRCPSGEDSGIFCRNPKPSDTSIHGRLFSTMDYTGGLDRFLELNFESGGKNYEACGNSYKTTESWRLDADPTSGTVVYPWFVKHFPISVNWTHNITILEYYTLMVYDAGYLVSRGLYVNIPQNKIDDIDSSEIIQHYGGPLLAMDIKNPYVFLLFKQNGSIIVTDEWKNKVTNGNLAGSWTIEAFASAMNMQGLVAINWITVTGDEWSAQTMMEKGGPYAMCPVFATKALHRKERRFIPTDVQLSVWIDFEFMPPTDKTINVCCKETKYSARNFSLNPLGDQNFSTWEVRSESPHKLTLSKLGYFVERHNFIGDMYTLISVDPDVPLPSAGTETRPILHGLVTNIMDGNIKTGDFGLHWAGPFPPNDVPHYYYTLLYKQQSTLNGTELRFNYTGNACSTRLYGRCLYDINRAVAENNLTLVGATWFTSQKDAYVLERQLNQTGSDEAEVCKGQPGYSNPCTTGAATVVFPSIVYVCITISFLLAF